MTDFAITVFRLVNDRGYLAPLLNIQYVEEDTNAQWTITCGGTRAYLVRYGPQLNPDLGKQAADSHFMVRRLASSLLLGGAGLFQAKAAGRLLFRDVEGFVKWDSHLEPYHSREYVERVADWLQALTQNTFLRRAADDAHRALSFPHEAIVYIYRGFEWLQAGLGITWREFAEYMNVPESQFTEMKKMANYETGVRHASRSGKKMRPTFDVYGTWVCGLLEAINAARVKLEPDFQPMTADEIAEAVARAAVLPFD